LSRPTCFKFCFSA